MPCDCTLIFNTHVPKQTTDIQALILKLCEARAGTSICPSEAARAISKDGKQWRALMPTVREAARELAKQGLIRVTQKDYEFGLEEEYRGAIRLRLV
jgi:Protein of unknown function (DUF3253)